MRRAPYARGMDGLARGRSLLPSLPRWTGELANWFERRAERLAESPEAGLALAEKRLAKSLGHQGPAAWRTINAMEAVAKFREGMGRHPDALALREQVVALRREQHGGEHQLTLAAEARLAVTLIELRRPSEAKPLLVHVLAGLSAVQGSDEPTVLAVTERLADVELALGESEDARRLLEEEMAHYEERGEYVRASEVAVKLATVLIRAGHAAEAPELLRKAVDVRSRALGPDDPETLTSLRNLASSLVWTRELAEASIVARNLYATSRRIKGPEDPGTLDAERLVASIDRRLGEGPE